MPDVRYLPFELQQLFFALGPVEAQRVFETDLLGRFGSIPPATLSGPSLGVERPVSRSGGSFPRTVSGGRMSPYFVQSSGTPTVLSGAPSLLGTIQAAAAPLVSALASRVASPVRAFTSAQETGVVRRAPTTPAGACGCVNPSQVRKCGPQFIDADFTGPDFLAIGNPCQDPCYSRPVARLTYDSNGHVQGATVVCAPPRRKPRMNPLNPRAAGRAARRLRSAGKAFKRIKKATGAAARSY